jgi:hypothetical protein
MIVVNSSIKLLFPSTRLHFDCLDHSFDTMVFGEPGSIWQQLSRFCFSTAGLFNDLLCGRFSLTGTHLFLVILGFMGGPRWSNSFQPTGSISIDTVIWAVFNLFVHLNSVVRYVTRTHTK